MELLLNIVWLVVAVGLGTLLALHQRKRKEKVAVLTVALTFVCLAVLLFPPISISDDLHPVKFTIEDCARKSASLGFTMQPQIFPLIAGIALVSVLCPPFVTCLQERTETIHQIHDGFSSPTESRGPPSPRFA